MWSNPNPEGQIIFTTFRKDDHSALFACLPDGELVTEQDINSIAKQFSLLVRSLHIEI